MNRLRDVNREQLQTKVSKTGLRFRNECGSVFLDFREIWRTCFMFSGEVAEKRLFFPTGW